MNIFRPGDSLAPCTRNSIFLVGPTPRAKEVRSWRPDALKELSEAGFPGDVLVPEPFAGDTQSQILWELQALERCGTIAAWVPRSLPEMPGFTTNIEIGRWLDSGKLFYGRPDGAAHTGYLDFVYKDVYSRKPADTLASLLKSAMDFLKLRETLADDDRLQWRRVVDQKTRFSRWCWFLPGPPGPQPLCIVLDAEYYLAGMQSLKLLRDATGQGLLPPMSFLFVSNVDETARHTDFACNDAYAKFIAVEAVNWAEKQSTDVTFVDNIICGLSLSGLQSAFNAVSYPEVFTRVISQSGSFWHEQEKFAVATEGRRLRNSRFWLSVGDQETQEYVEHTPQLVQRVSQIQGVAWAAEMLRERGAAVKPHIYQGGHSVLPWQRELVEALQWVSKPPG